MCESLAEIRGVCIQACSSVYRMGGRAVLLVTGLYQMLQISLCENELL